MYATGSEVLDFIQLYLTCTCYQAQIHIPFLVQIGDDRMSWDSYCLELNIVDRDPSTGSEVVHWVLKYPVRTLTV